MTQAAYRFTFHADLPVDEVEATLLLAVLAAQSLHGESGVFLDVAHSFDAGRRACLIDAGTPAGRDVSKLFTGFLRKEFGPDAFQVERVREGPGALTESAAAGS